MLTDSLTLEKDNKEGRSASTLFPSRSSLLTVAQPRRFSFLKEYMASPQLEKGYTRLANEIIEAISESNLSGSEIRATLMIIRLTYGFQRKEMTANVNAFATKLKTTRSYVLELLSNLESKKVITVEWASKDLCKVIFIKDFDKWRCFL